MNQNHITSLNVIYLYSCKTNENKFRPRIHLRSIEIGAGKEIYNRKSKIQKTVASNKLLGSSSNSYSYIFFEKTVILYALTYRVITNHVFLMLYSVTFT